MSWWRAHDKSVNNRKLQRLPGELFKAWYNVNCLASGNGGVVPPIEDVAFALRLTEQRAAAVLTQLATAKLLDKDGDNLIPHDWDEHQFKSDKTDPTAPLRQKRYRDKKRNDRNATVTDTVTVKRPEAEAESDTEQSRADASAPIDEELKKREAGLRAGIGAHFASRGQKVPENMDRVLLWLTQGYAAGTVLKAVEKVLKRGKPISTLDYFDGAIGDEHEKAPPSATPNEQIVSGQFAEFVIFGTPEWNAWQMVSGSRGTPTRERRDAEGRIQTGWDFPKRWPDGFDEATGEKLHPASEEDAA
jgi:hypothetical protein